MGKDEKDYIGEVVDAVQHHLNVVLPIESVHKLMAIVENNVFFSVVQKASEQAIEYAADSTDEGQRAVMCGKARAYISMVQLLQQLRRIANV